VKGIKKIVGKELFKEMKEFEFQRFKNNVSCNDIKNVICFQEDAKKEIKEYAYGKRVCSDSDYEVYQLGGVLENVLLFKAPPTRRLQIPEDKKILCSIISKIKGV